MKKNLAIAVLFTLVTTVVFGLIYPLVVTGLAQVLFRDRANGQVIERGGQVVGSRIIGQEFSGAGYFHSRPATPGIGYDGMSSGGSNFGPTNKALIERVNGSVAQARTENPGAAVPVDLVTASGSGLDPDISPAAANFQIPRIAEERRASEADVAALVGTYTRERQLGFLGEPRVNVLELNLALDEKWPTHSTK